jgi:hypothetical protein
MKRLNLAALLLLAAMVPACLTARLGETELQCETRYGKPVKNPSATLSTETYTRRYKYDGWDIEATFVNRRVAKQSYSLDRTMKHTVNLTEATPSILQAEAGGGEWQSYVIGPPAGYQNGIDASASKWRNTNGRIAYPNYFALIVEEKGYAASTTPTPAPKKLPKF